MNTKSNVLPKIELRHVALQPLHNHVALIRLATSFGEHVRREIQPDARIPVGRDGDQLVHGTAAELEYLAARPTGFGTVEVDRGTAAGKHQVV